MDETCHSSAAYEKILMEDWIIELVKLCFVKYLNKCKERGLSFVPGKLGDGHHHLQYASVDISEKISNLDNASDTIVSWMTSGLPCEDKSNYYKNTRFKKQIIIIEPLLIGGNGIKLYDPDTGLRFIFFRTNDKNILKIKWEVLFSETCKCMGTHNLFKITLSPNIIIL